MQLKKAWSWKRDHLARGYEFVPYMHSGITFVLAQFQNCIILYTQFTSLNNWSLPQLLVPGWIRSIVCSRPRSPQTSPLSNRTTTETSLKWAALIQSSIYTIQCLYVPSPITGLGYWTVNFSPSNMCWFLNSTYNHDAQVFACFLPHCEVQHTGHSQQSHRS